MVEFGRRTTVKTATNVGVGLVETALGVAEWAATQIVHFDASVALE